MVAFLSSLVETVNLISKFLQVKEQLKLNAPSSRPRTNELVFGSCVVIGVALGPMNWCLVLVLCHLLVVSYC